MRALPESSDCRKVFSNLMIRLTPDNSNPRYLEPKSISPGFPSYIYCKFTLDNANLPLTRSSFCFPSEHLYKILPLITRTMFEPLKVGKKQSTGVPNIDLNFPLTCCRHIAVMHQSIPAAPSPPPPPGYCRVFARLVSPGGGAFPNFALSGGRAFANPGAISEFLTRTQFPIRI